MEVHIIASLSIFRVATLGTSSAVINDVHCEPKTLCNLNFSFKRTDVSDKVEAQRPKSRSCRSDEMKDEIVMTAMMMSLIFSRKRKMMCSTNY